MTLHVGIDRERCMGSGNCAYWAPAIFDLDDEGIAVVIGAPGDDAEGVHLATEHCPTGALSVREE